MKVFVYLAAALAAQFAYAGRTVQHQHKCPGIFTELDVCVNYEGLPQVIPTTGEKETPFTVVLYTWNSAYSESGEREYVDVDGTLIAELMMAHSSGEHMSQPVKLEKISVGKYLVHGAYFTMPGMWSLTVDLERPGYTLRKRAGLYVYIYPDDAPTK